MPPSDHPSPAPTPPPPAHTPPTPEPLDRRFLLGGLAGAAGAAALAGIGRTAHAGPLNPPAGAVAPTPGPEPRTPINATNTPGDADSQFRITQPGSYYLTANIAGVTGKRAIEISASGVSIDLCGFDINGVADALDGIAAPAGNPRNITVRNGSIRNFGGIGVNLALCFCTLVEGITSSGNGDDGISIGGASVAVNCTAHSNAGIGIVASFGSALHHCTAYSSGGNGISIATACTADHCSSYSSDANGFTGSNSVFTACNAVASGTNGFSVSSNSVVIGCNADTSGGDGIRCAGGCLILNNRCSDNGQSDGAGIHATGAANRIEANHCRGADRGIDVDAAGNIIIRNTCAGNTTDWSIAADNALAPIVDRRTVTAAQVNGFSSPTSLGTTDANANFSL